MAIDHRATVFGGLSAATVMVNELDGKWAGAGGPVDTNATINGRANNRRVVIRATR